MSLVPMKFAVVLLFAAISVTAGPSFAGPKRISGAASAAASTNCANKGGTESGNMCTLPNGNSCQTGELARLGKCLDENGVEVAEPVSEEGSGTDEGSDTSGGT
jgi:putative hemolysin